MVKDTHKIDSGNWGMARGNRVTGRRGFGRDGSGAGRRDGEGGNEAGSHTQGGEIRESLSIVVPMYNEERNALRVIGSLEKALRGLTDDYEIIIIESGSTDSTGAIVDTLAKTMRHCKVFHEGAKKGLGSAIRYGFRESAKDIVLYMDGDEPFSIDEIKRALPLIRDCDAVIGYRIGHRENFTRWFYSKSYNFLTRHLLGLKVHDVNFSFKMVRRDAARELDLRANTFFFSAELLSELKRKGFRWKEMGIPYTLRAQGVSSVRITPSLIGNILKEMAHYLFR
ncbi:glycosyltransferase family 2 protein [Candidatus Woesearchaeota archaeon]|nr:glycosyltransferase family 2 protein [Candidatus Woesearchaeota archaeon]